MRISYWADAKLLGVKLEATAKVPLE